MGTRIGLNKSIPLHFGFFVMPDGKLEVIDPAKQLIGAGTWTFDNDVFAVKYAIYPSGFEYSAKSAFFVKPDKMGGSWGHGSDDENGGTWEMTKTN